MSVWFVFPLMIFCHIIDDYYLQGILASMKQKKWWEENAPDVLYKHDYLMALAMHSFSWAFMIMLPVALFYGFNTSADFLLIMIMNAIIHATVDHQKANVKKINLITDQCIHILQIVGTYLLFVFQILK